MFTIKFYSGDGCRQIIREAESVTVLRDPRGTEEPMAEVTMHYKNGESARIDVGSDRPRQEGWPPLFAKAIIENAAGRTTEIIGSLGPTHS